MLILVVSFTHGVCVGSLQSWKGGLQQALSPKAECDKVHLMVTGRG